MTAPDAPAVLSAEPRVWSCKIGSREDIALPPDADVAMRAAVREAFKTLTGRDAEFAFTGWGGTLTEGQLAVVENRLPRVTEPHCEYSCPGRGDCAHFVGLSDTLTRDHYGKPVGWCWWCWRSHQLDEAKADATEAWNAAGALRVVRDELVAECARLTEENARLAKRAEEGFILRLVNDLEAAMADTARLRALVEQREAERLTLAKLAADVLYFDPFDAEDAVKLRDQVLAAPTSPESRP